MLHNSLNADAVAVSLVVPEKYVLGEAFTPQAVLSLPEGTPQQQAGVLVSVPLQWNGLEKILADNTGTVWDRMERTAPAVVWFVLLALLLLAGGVLARIAYVRHRRYKRRMLRLAAAQAQRPIRAEKRPPNQPRSGKGQATRKPSTPTIRVVYHDSAVNQPRRVGRAR